MEKIYLQNSQDIEETLKHIGFDSIEQAEKICGRNIYALKVDYYDGDLGNVVACHDYLEDGRETKLTEEDSSQLLKWVENERDYFRAGQTHILYQFCVDYHGGQTSRGYALVCRLARRIERLIGKHKIKEFYNGDIQAKRKELRETFEYKELEKQYSNKI